MNGAYSQRTLSVGSDVLRINTAHSISVFGGFSEGTTGSGRASADFSGEGVRERCDRSGGGGGGSAKSEEHESLSVNTLQGESCKPSETGRNSTSRQLVPPSGAATHTMFSVGSSSFLRTSTAYVQALRPVSLCPVRKSKSYLLGRLNVRIAVRIYCTTYIPMPGAYKNKAAFAFLNLSMRDVCT